MHSTLAIRCRARAPLATHDLERWLARLADELHKESPELHPRISRLTPARGCDDSHRGWLLELELPTENGRRGSQRVDDALTDMRLLGLEATPLTPTDSRRPKLSGETTRPR